MEKSLTMRASLRVSELWRAGWHWHLNMTVISANCTTGLGRPMLWIQEAQLSQRGRAMLRVIEYFAESLKVSQGHSKWHCWVGRSIPLNMCLYLVPFLRYSASNDGVTLKLGVRVVQGRWMCRPIASEGKGRQCSSKLKLCPPPKVCQTYNK